MNNDKLIKGLECIARTMDVKCAECPYSTHSYPNCQMYVANAAADTIRKLQVELADARYLNTVAADDAIQEFALQLKEVVQISDDSYECWEIEDFINDLVKEMTQQSEDKEQ